MAHELTLNKITGLVEMGYAPGVDRWHGLGNEWLESDTLEVKAEKAGMLWTAKRARVRYGDGPAQRIINDQHVLFRSDTKDALGIVSDKYEIVQPAEAIRFFDRLVKDGAYKLKTAGTLYGGRKYWATAARDEEGAKILCDDDRMEEFLLFSGSLDGSSKTAIQDSSICVVCDNTLRMAQAGRKSVNIGVNHRQVFDEDYVHSILEASNENFKALIQMARTLAKAKCDDLKAQDFITALLVKQVGASEDRIKEGKHVGFNKIMSLFSGEGKGSELKGRAGTLWGAVNAVTEYVDQHAAAATAENRLSNAWFGAGDALKTAALSSALALV